MKEDEMRKKIRTWQDVCNTDVISTPLPMISKVLAHVGIEDPSITHILPLEYLISNLTNEEWTARVAAAHTLGQIADRTSLPFLLTASHDPSAPVRAAAIEALGVLGSRTSSDTLMIDTIVNALDDPEWEVRETAVFVLGQQRNPASISLLVKALSDEDESVRAAAVQAIGKVGFNTPIKLIIAALNDESGIVREAAVMALSQLNRRAPIAALMSALYDELECVRVSAMQSLANLEASPLVKEVFAAYEHDTMQPAAKEAFRVCINLTLTILSEQTPIEPILAILKELQGQVNRASLYYLIARALNELDEYTPIEPLLSLLQSDDASLRSKVWQMITLFAQSMLYRRTQVEMLIAASQEQERVVRIEAEQAIIELVDLALKILGEQKETTHLVAILQGEDRFAAEAVMRSLVGQGLKVLEEPLSVESLLTTLRHHESPKRAAAGHLLAQRAREALIERQSPSVPVVISWKNPYRTAPTKLQIGSSFPEQRNEKHTILPWRDFTPMQGEKPYIAILSNDQRTHLTVQWN